MLDSIQFINRKEMVVLRCRINSPWKYHQSRHYTLIPVDKKLLTVTRKNFKINIDNKLISNFKAANICGFVKGTAQPDSFLLLRRITTTGWFRKGYLLPRANDNASGVSLLLNLAHYYSLHPQRYSIGFICFAGRRSWFNWFKILYWKPNGTT